MKTDKKPELKRDWHLIDLDGKALGRVATEISVHLIGKNKPTYMPNLERGDYIVAINAAKIKITGKKLTDKSYFSHSGFPGGLHEITLGALMAKDPRKVIEKAVRGMLPKNKLQDIRMTHLKIFVDSNHPYAVELGQVKKEDKAEK